MLCFFVPDRILLRRLRQICAASKRKAHTRVQRVARIVDDRIDSIASSSFIIATTKLHSCVSNHSCKSSTCFLSHPGVVDNLLGLFPFCFATTLPPTFLKIVSLFD